MFTLSEIDNIVKKGVSSLNFKIEPKELYEPIEYMLSIGGKRLRPKMCIMGYNLFANEIDKAILNPALALEVFHGFTLIHDDIMDKADLRRGQQTVHNKWNNNIAILSGDVMSIKAYELLSSAPAEYLPAALSLFSKTAAEVCEGQQYDMNFESLPIIVMDDYIKMIGLKTAALMACSIGMGAIIGGADKKIADALYKFGYELGIAFQIQDDYLDTFGDSSIFGKSIGGDILNNKKTWLLVESIKRATGEDKVELERLLNLNAEGEQNVSAEEKCRQVKISEEKILGMQELYVKLGVKESAEAEILVYHKRAMDIIAGLEFTEAQVAQLDEFATMLIKRIK